MMPDEWFGIMAIITMMIMHATTVSFHQKFDSGESTFRKACVLDTLRDGRLSMKFMP